MCRKEGDSIEQEREIILVFPDDNNPYGLGTAAMPLTLEERGELAVWRVTSFLDLYHWHLFLPISLWIESISLLGMNCTPKLRFQQYFGLNSFVQSFKSLEMLFQSLLFVHLVQVGIVDNDEWKVDRMWIKWIQRQKHGSMFIRRPGYLGTDRRMNVSLELWKIDLLSRNEIILMGMESL